MNNIIGVYNPYGLIQKAGKNKTHKKTSRTSIHTRNRSRMLQSRKKTRSCKRKSYCRKK